MVVYNSDNYNAVAFVFMRAVISDVLVNYDKHDTVSILFFIFPIYAVLSCYYAYKSYEARRDLSVILLCVLLLAYVGCYFLF